MAATIKINHVSKKHLEEIWAQVPVNYYDLGIANNPFQKFWHKQKLAQILKLLPFAPEKVIDIGCSSAVLTAEIAKRLPKSNVIGVDSYKAAIDFARKKYPHMEFFAADAHKLPFKSNTFDLVICTETLEHVIDPFGVLKEIKRLLKRDGKVIISMDSGSLLFRIAWYFWTKFKGKVWKDAHLHEFNTNILENLIKKSGFRIKIKKISHFGMSVIFLAS
ncbi:hypothetical protein A3F02_02010 [Candidatus Curtissbacteria bacterium RIFCSPHIGHO2_12_FULL_38_9b]|uniref:Methyltransferase type 11 domain-containing protein n=2 Tax=Candidatus Curtissiibacteriota TaxID=1752717 RepID=A0A1F5GXX5_9BACT|nr:MAG: hypothetical protein A3A48_00380 [Candidatus Curtissbacteria bacterium RIFCSPLOWO2_01_FULL_37_9]OGD96654.1 MAG: hypothetical protein A3F02_02010 [Candidatus Curtissbacteria bacterium RIFCSPHIGHO2_12_FULL_38_9b]